MNGRKHWDAAVLGGGIAGCCAAWALRFAGKRVLLIDRGGRTGASWAAAGLISPIAGQRLAGVWKFNQFWPAALGFYSRVEAAVAAPLLTVGPAVWCFTSDKQRLDFRARSLSPWLEAAELSSEESAAIQLSVTAPYGAMQISPSGRLDVAAFLEATHRAFAAEGAFEQAALAPLSEEMFQGAGPILLAPHSATADRLILCTGSEDPGLPRWKHLPWTLSTGETLTARLEGYLEQRVVHGPVWVAPQGGGLYRVGATFDRNRTDGLATEAGRYELLSGLRTLITGTIEVREHRAGVRPTLADRKPLAGWLPGSLGIGAPRIGLLTGLGAHGSLRAPWLALRLAETWTTGGWASTEASADRFTKSPPRIRPTELAHQIVAASLVAGDLALDATAGNGADTEWLARCVGPTGGVLAIDPQQVALDRTAERLGAARASGAAMANVELVCGSHALLQRLCPEWSGRVGAVMFNLGYLPGGDPAITTLAASTCEALSSAIAMLRPGGVVTVLAYPGHPAGARELLALEAFFKSSALKKYQIDRHDPTPGRTPGPVLFVLRYPSP